MDFSGAIILTASYRPAAPKDNSRETNFTSAQYMTVNPKGQ